MRTYVGAPVVGFLVPRLIGKRLRGIPRGIAVVALSVCVTSPVTNAVVALLFASPDEFTDAYLSALEVSLPMTMIANYLVIGPIVNLAFNRIKPDAGLRALNTLAQHAPYLSRILGQ